MPEYDVDEEVFMGNTIVSVDDFHRGSIAPF